MSSSVVVSAEATKPIHWLFSMVPQKPGGVKEPPEAVLPWKLSPTVPQTTGAEATLLLGSQEPVQRAPQLVWAARPSEKEDSSTSRSERKTGSIR